MSTTPESSHRMSIFGSSMLALSALFWIATIGLAVRMNESDAAGNSLSFSIGVLSAGALGIALALLLVSVGLRGALPAAGRLAALLLVPAAAASVVAAFNLLRLHATPPAWPGALVVVLPALILGYVVWAVFPTTRALLPPGRATAIVWGSVFVLAVAPWPPLLARQRAIRAQRDRQEEERLSREVSEKAARAAIAQSRPLAPAL